MKALEGKKTYIVMLGFLAVGVGGFFTGEMTMQEAVMSVLTGLGIGGLRSGLKKGGM